MELTTHPGMYVSANLYATGVVKVTLAKTDLVSVFNQIRDSLSTINLAAQQSCPPVSVYDSTHLNSLAWADLKLALVKKQFDLGFRIKYEFELHKDVVSDILQSSDAFLLDTANWCLCCRLSKESCESCGLMCIDVFLFSD
jgi:hypothetical protein